MTRPMPRQPLPDIELPTIDGEGYSLAENQPEKFTMLVVYRGYHCPICRGQLTTLQENLGTLAELGVEVVAASMDGENRARSAQKEWGLDALRIAYGMSEEQARSLGLYISSAIREGEPERFSEPGLFLIRPDATLYGASIQTMPFTRPPIADLLQALTFLKSNEYPARGEIPG